VNIGEPWPDLDEAELRVHAMQTKLHQWAISDPDRCFDDLYNLVYDPAFLVVAWSRVRDNKGGRSAGVDGVVPRSIVFSAGGDRLEETPARRPSPTPTPTSRSATGRPTCAPSATRGHLGCSGSQSLTTCGPRSSLRRWSNRRQPV